jgi:DNA-binding NarL/FixJ family response regulator
MKILVVDDHALIREALRSVLGQLRRNAEVIEAADWRQAARLLEETPGFDLVLLDLNLPDRDGFDILAELRSSRPATAVAVLSALQDRASVARALAQGAVGFIPKSAPREVMIGAFNLIFCGGMYIPPEILAAPVPLPLPGRAAAPVRAALSPADFVLTERQLDVLALMMQGRSNKLICRELDLAEPTVKNHVTAILKALKATNRTQAVIAARDLGFDPRRRDTWLRLLPRTST